MDDPNEEISDGSGKIRIYIFQEKGGDKEFYLVRFGRKALEKPEKLTEKNSTIKQGDNEVRSRPKKPLYKKIVFWLLVILIIIAGLVGMYILTNNDEISYGPINEDTKIEKNEISNIRKNENGEGLYAATSDFDQLPEAIKVHVVASLVDDRAKEHNLEGFTLNYNIEGDILYLEVHSGAGVGHPIYKLQIDSDSITPLEDVVRVSAEEIEVATVDASVINKNELYNEYLDHKETYENGQSNVWETSSLTEESYEEVKNRIE